MTQDYEAFRQKKLQCGSKEGFAPVFMPDCLFDFQASLVDWNIWCGRSATFADCGLGKSLMELVVAENILRKINKRVLILTPLAVASQTVREGEKFGIECRRSAGDLRNVAEILVTNYEKLHLFNPHDFGAVICDESSAIKSFDGQRRAQVTEFLRTIPYRLLCTATAAPNDYTELGTSSEALGVLGLVDMLNKFFINDQNNSSTKRAWANQGGGTPKFRFRGHAAVPFWKWVCSWARACRKPSDLGFNDGKFILPPLIEREHIVEARTLPPGMLFPSAARNRNEELEERRRTIAERCEKAAQLVAHNRPAVIWCHLNDEGDMLERIIPDGKQVSGKMSDEEKEGAYEAFRAQQVRTLIVKPKIGAWGLNWQFCNHVVTFADHSFEQRYQGIRRCWRFGQELPVTVDTIATEGEARISENLRRKSEAADRMFTELVSYMHAAERLDSIDRFTHIPEVPQWLA